MRILLYTDIHHGSALRYGRIDKNGLNSRLSASLAIEDFISKVIEEEQIDFVFFLGDLVERSIYSHINDMVREKIFKRAKQCPHIYMRGNHDRYFKGFDVYGDVFNPFEQVIRRPQVLFIQDISIGFLPYSEGSINEHVDILLVHRDILGADLGFVTSNIGENINELSEKADKVFCGHIHIPQILSKNVVCLGSVVPTDLGECDGLNRGIYVYDTDTKELLQIDPPVPKLVKYEAEPDSFRSLLNDIQNYQKNNLVLYVKGERALLMEIIKKKDLIEKEIEFENLLLIPQPIDTSVSYTNVPSILGESPEARLRDFVIKANVEGLDKNILIQKGLNILNGIRTEKNTLE